MSDDSLICIEEDPVPVKRRKIDIQNVPLREVLLEPYRRIWKRLMSTFPFRYLGRCILIRCCKRVLHYWGFSRWLRKRTQLMDSENDDPDEEERRELVNQIRSLQSQLDNLDSEHKALRYRHHEETANNQREIEHFKQLNRNSELRIMELNRERDELKKAKDEALSRLSEMMGVKLRENNPAITDLNDPNRPMKLGEQFNELYENEWTEAFLELQDLKTDDTSLNEEQAVKILLNILKEINEQSIAELTLQLSGLLQSVQGLPEDDIKDFIKSIKDAYKANSGKYASLIHKKISTDALHCPTVVKYVQCCESYIENCAKICYLAAVQDPPMLLHFDPETVYDKQIFKEYTTMGRRVKFLVWPALFLHKGGPLLSKGVVQPLPDVD
ncbi:interaptin-like isoform X2 [Mytilus edulis]